VNSSDAKARIVGSGSFKSGVVSRRSYCRFVCHSSQAIFNGSSSLTRFARLMSSGDEISSKEDATKSLRSSTRLCTVRKIRAPFCSSWSTADRLFEWDGMVGVNVTEYSRVYGRNGTCLILHRRVCMKQYWSTKKRKRKSIRVYLAKLPKQAQPIFGYE